MTTALRTLEIQMMHADGGGVACLLCRQQFPNLTYIEARQALRDSAVKFDLANTDPIGQWLDVNGNPSVMSGLPAVRSGWYGYGRVDAAGAVDNALTLAATRDLVIAGGRDRREQRPFHRLRPTAGDDLQTAEILHDPWLARAHDRSQRPAAAVAA